MSILSVLSPEEKHINWKVAILDYKGEGTGEITNYSMECPRE